MSGEDTRRAPALRERLLAIIRDPIIPPQWRDRAIALHGEITADPDADPRARDLIDAAALYHRLWDLHDRIERIVSGARSEPEAIAWRADATELLDSWDRGGAQ